MVISWVFVHLHSANIYLYSPSLFMIYDTLLLLYWQFIKFTKLNSDEIHIQKLSMVNLKGRMTQTCSKAQPWSKLVHCESHAYLTGVSDLSSSIWVHSKARCIVFCRVLMMVYDIHTHRLFGLLPLYVLKYNTLCFWDRFVPVFRLTSPKTIVTT